MARLLADDLDPNLCVNIRVQPDRHRVEAQRLDWLAQLDAATVHLQPLLRQPLGDVLGGDRAEEPALFAGLAGNGDRHGGEATREALGSGALGLDPAGAGLRLRHDPLLVSLGRFVGEPLGQQEVPRIAWPYPHQLAGPPERLDVFSQDDFDHRSNPPVPGDTGRRRKSSQVSARPRSVSPPTTNGNRKKATTATTVAVSRGSRPAPAPTTARP